MYIRELYTYKTSPDKKFCNLKFMDYLGGGHPQGDPIPKEIWDYALEHEQYNGKPLTAAVCREIAKILDEEDI